MDKCILPHCVEGCRQIETDRYCIDHKSFISWSIYLLVFLTSASVLGSERFMVFLCASSSEPANISAFSFAVTAYLLIDYNVGILKDIIGMSFVIIKSLVDFVCPSAEYLVGLFGADNTLHVLFIKFLSL